MNETGAMPNVGLVLAGAVAKGSFEIGAASVLAASGCRITRVAATSSGALNAAILGAGLAFDRLALAVDVATELWTREGSWTGIAHVSLGAWIHLEGALDTRKLAALVKEGIAEVARRAGALGPPPTEDTLRVTLVTADLHGLPDDGPLLTHERPIAFTASDFRNPARWDDIATAAAASASFPALFAPTLVGGDPCVDGGAVNNAPISYLLDENSTIDSVVAITPQPVTPDPLPATLGGANLVSHVADALTNERLSRDLVRASTVNARLRAVDRAMADSNVSAEATVAIRAALAWRPLHLTLICPATSLPGTSFAGFGDAKLRVAYIAAGVEAAKNALVLE
jgi:NTE family protein